MQFARRNLFTAICLILAVCTACSQSHPLYPSYEELTRRGFYVYTLPEREIEQRGWSQRIWIWSWDRHCRGIEEVETFNPLAVDYVGSESGLFMRIGPWTMWWNSRAPAVEVNLGTPWARDGSALYLTERDTIYLRFIDRFGVPVLVTSVNLKVDELVYLLNQLEYIGPPPEAVSGPWDPSKCPRTIRWWP